MSSNVPAKVDLISDATGETAERVVRAALLQFPQAAVELRRHSRVRTKEMIEPIVLQAARDRSLLIHSIVSPELSDYVHRRADALKLLAVDVLGSAIAGLQSHLNRQPMNRPGTLMPLNEDYFRRIEAVEFTVKSDAGRDPAAFLLADLVLVGVSRTSKTALSTLLAQRGLKVANLTLVRDQTPPSELFKAARVVGLTLDADKLCSIRQKRLEKLGMPSELQYGVRDHVVAELAYADSIFQANPDWVVVDTTNQTIDETAAAVLSGIGR